MNAKNQVPTLSLPTPPRTSIGGLFVSSSAVILVVTGLAKVWTGLSHTKVLAVADPITGLAFGHLMLAVGVAELVIASICLLGKSQKLKLGLVTWMTTILKRVKNGSWY